MQQHHLEWLELLHIRDNFYLYAFLLVLLAYGWYRFLKKSIKLAFKLAVLGAVIVVGLGWLWGWWHLFQLGG